MSATPIYRGQKCYGLDLRKVDLQQIRRARKVDLSFLIETYKNYPNKTVFFDHKQSKEIVVFEKLAGGRVLQEQIIAGMSEEEIRNSWKPGLEKYNVMRKKYLLYP